MHRFFVPSDLFVWDAMNWGPAQTITLPDKVAHQVRDVLHLGIGEKLILLDNTGDEVVAAIKKNGRNGVEVELLERRQGKCESSVKIILCQGLLKSARFEWILEKGTELGVSVFSPILCRRSMSGLEEAGSSKIQRWQRIIQEATEQCGRACLPELLPIRSLKKALADLPEGSLALMPWEEERGCSLQDILRAYRNATQEGRLPVTPQPTTIVLFIGPEGGLMAEEVEQAQEHGVVPVTLGPRILRAETAALTAIANVMYELEE